MPFSCRLPIGETQTPSIMTMQNGTLAIAFQLCHGQKNKKKAKKGILSMLNNALDDDRNLKYKSTSDLSVGKENPFFFGNEIWDTPHFAHFTD